MAEEYDTNPTMVGYTSREGIWRSLLVPGYTLKNSNEQNELNVGTALQLERSSNQFVSPNRNDLSVYTGLRHQADLSEIGLTAKYEEASTRNNLIDIAGQNFAESTRTSRTISGNWIKALNEFSTISADGSYEKVSYQGGSLINYNNQFAGVKFNRAISEVNKVFARLTKSKYESANGIVTNSVTAALLGWEWIYSENLHGSFQAGKSRAENIGASTQGAASLNYMGKRTELVLSAGRTITPSGLGDLYTVDQAKGNWEYAYSELNRFGIESEWQTSHLNTRAVSYLSTSAWFQHELDAFWVMKTYYLHKSMDRFGIGKAYSNMMGISFTYTYADL